MSETDRAGIERFVRGTLGCGCPDEAFQSIAISRLPETAGRPPIVQVLVGSRLLIHVVAPPTTGASASGWIEQLAAAGRAARDRHGYNRFRLVVAAPGGAAPAPDLESRFARAGVGDARMHLHVIAADRLPAVIGTPPNPANTSTIPAD